MFEPHRERNLHRDDGFDIRGALDAQITVVRRNDAGDDREVRGDLAAFAGEQRISITGWARSK